MLGNYYYFQIKFSMPQKITLNFKESLDDVLSNGSNGKTLIITAFEVQSM